MVLTKGDITRDRHSKTVTLHEGNSPVTGLAFRQVKSTHLFVATLEKVYVSQITPLNKYSMTMIQLFLILFSVILFSLSKLVLHPFHQGVSKSRAGFSWLCTALLILGRSISRFPVYCSWRWMCLFIPARWTRTLLCFWRAEAVGSLASWIFVPSQQRCEVTQQVRE